MPAIALHLYHLGDAIVKFIKSGRPLLHVVRMWTVVAPHLVEVGRMYECCNTRVHFGTKIDLTRSRFV